MKRALLTTCLAVFAALASPAAAETAGQRVQEAIIAQLSAQGFTRVRISNTLLGRTRIYATGPGISREIIFNPRTGEILRDYWDDDDGFEDGPVSPSATGGSSSTDSDPDTSSGSDRGDDDDDRSGDRNDDGASSNSDDDKNDDGRDDREADSKDDEDEPDDSKDDEKDEEDEKDDASDDEEDDEEDD